MDLSCDMVTANGVEFGISGMAAAARTGPETACSKIRPSLTTVPATNWTSTLSILAATAALAAAAANTPVRDDDDGDGDDSDY